jgi:hypothetical protein
VSFLSSWQICYRSCGQGFLQKLRFSEYKKSPFGDSHVEWYSDHQWLHVQMGCIEKESESSHKSESSWGSNILNRKEVVKEIPPYFKNQSVPIVSYSYTNSIGRKMFNYKETLQDINIEKQSVLRRKRINISVTSWQSVLLVEETRLPRETHWPAASHWQTLSYNVVSSTSHLSVIHTQNAKMCCLG